MIKKHSIFLLSINLFFCTLVVSQSNSKNDLYVECEILNEKIKDIDLDINTVDTLRYLSEELLNKSQLINDTSGLIFANFSLGRVYQLTNDYNTALSFYYKGISLSDSSIITRQKGNIYLNISVIHFRMQNLNRAQKYIDKSILILEKYPTESEIAMAYNTKGILEAESGDFDRAKTNWLRSFEYSKEIKDSVRMVQCYNNIGSLEVKLKKYKSAIKYFNESQKMLIDSKNESEIIIKMSLASCYFELAEFNKAQVLIQEAINLFNDGNSLSLKAEIYLLASKISEQNNLLEKALFFKNKHVDYTDSLAKKNTIEEYVDLEVKKKAVNDTTPPKEKQNNNTFLYLILFVVVLFGLFMTLKFKNKNKFNDIVVDTFKTILSQREVEVAELIIEGYSSNQIGEKLFISLNTVKTHRKNIYKKLNISSVAELAELFSK